MTSRLPLACAALLVVLLLAGCGDDDDAPEPEPTTSSEETFDEGTVRMVIEVLDTGLLKGRAYVTAAEGWRVDGIDIVAADEAGVDWPVIEIPEKQDATDFVEFFEVTIQELPRGDQVTVTAKAFFIGDTPGLTSERSVQDQWPP
jgi:hypothetical protein